MSFEYEKYKKAKEKIIIKNILVREEYLKEIINKNNSEKEDTLFKIFGLLKKI
jgi:hypothetical protein